MNYFAFNQDGDTRVINRETGEIVVFRLEGVKHFGFEDWLIFRASDGGVVAFERETRQPRQCDGGPYTPIHDREAVGTTGRSDRSNGAIFLDEDTGHTYALYGGRYYPLDAGKTKVRPRASAKAHWIHIGNLTGRGSDFVTVYYQTGRKTI